MTSEELLNKHVFVPSIINESIIANLLMGNCVLCEYYDDVLHKFFPICLTLSTHSYINYFNYGLRMPKNLENMDITVAASPCGEPPIVWIDNIYSNCLLRIEQCKDILEYFIYD